MNRPAKEHRFKVPSRADIISLFNDLIQEKTSREIISDWAIEYMLFDNPQIYPKIEDSSVWDAIQLLGSVDLKTDKGAYLYGTTDFQAWLTEFKATK